MRGLFWFRSDLRVKDNLALYNASHQCRDGLAAVYYLPLKTWKQHGVSGNKIDFILRHLKTMKVSLDELNIPLMVVETTTFDASVDELCQFVKDNNIDKVYFNKEYEWDELKRDERAQSALEKLGAEVITFDDTVIAPPGEVLSPKDKPYIKFTPFKKTFMAWLSQYGRLDPVKLPEKQVETLGKASHIPGKVSGFDSLDLAERWPAGEEAANKKLSSFVKHHLDDYADSRNFPSEHGTSELSAYLNIGAISARMCIHKALQSKAVKNKEGVDTWVSELVWREFYKHISFFFPEVCKGHNFNRQYDSLKWENDTTLQQAWMVGKTGFPLVDAAMRQLLDTGWMHNRLRMLVAMFFTKLMFQDWRIGEAYFMENLIDGDFSANNGGWQWCASTGTDSVPYFRIFNPVTQSKNFDPNGEFIKKYCPELTSLSSKEIHDPWEACPEKMEAIGYPKPIIDYKLARERALSAYKSA